MSWEQALLIGVLAGSGTYLVMHRTLTRIILGLGVLGNAVNLLILASGDGPGGPASSVIAPWSVVHDRVDQERI